MLSGLGRVFGIPLAIGAMLIAGEALATPIGVNIIVNGDAEAGAGSASGNDVEPIPGWSTSSNFTVVRYGAPAFPTVSDASAIGGGTNLFAGGQDTAVSSAVQTMSIADLASPIDASGVTASLSAYLGGFDGQADNMTVTVTFLNASATSIGTLGIGPVTQADRGGNTELLLRSSDGAVPAGTRSITITMDATRFAGSYDDGYADNLSLVLNGSVAPPTGVPEPSALALLAVGLLSAFGAHVTRRRSPGLG